MIWPEIAAFLALVLAAEGLGRLLATPLAGRTDPLTGAMGLVVRQALGLAAILALAGLLSLVHALRPWPVAVVLVVPAVWGLWGLVRTLKGGRATDPEGWEKTPLSGWEKLLLAGIVVHLAVALIQALAPPTWGDGLHVMFVFARDYGREGMVHYLPTVYASRPQNMTLLFSLVQLFGGPEGGQLISWWLGLLSVSAIIAFVGRWSGRTVGLVAGLMVAGMPLIGQLTGRGMSGTGLIFFGLMGILAVVAAFRSNRPLAWAVPAGLCLGLAAGFKVAGLTVVIVGCGLAVFEVFRRRKAPLAALLIIALSLVAASPWYVYAWAHTGQVFYRGGELNGPLAATDMARWRVSLPDQTKVPAESDQTALAVAKGVSPGGDFLARRLKKRGRNPLANLWRINTLDGHRGRNVGPFILALTPLLLLIRPVNRPALALTIIGLGHAGLTTFLLGPYARYAIVGLCLASAGAAWAWWSLVRMGGWRKGAAVALLVIGWGAVLPERGYTVIRDMPTALGLADRAAYTARFFPEATAVYGWANAHLPERARVVVIAESRPWFLERTFFDAGPDHSPLFDYEAFTDWRDLDRAVRAVGADYAVINWQRSDNAWERGRAGVDSRLNLVKKWAEARLTGLHSHGRTHLYVIKQD